MAEIKCMEVKKIKYEPINSILQTCISSSSFTDSIIEIENIESCKTTIEMTVDAISIANATCLKFLPLGLKKKFPQLKALVVEKSGLMHIDQSDMEPLGFDLLYISFQENKITALESDLFEYNKNIMYVSFKNNPLKYIDPNFMTGFKQWNSSEFKLEVNLNNCTCICMSFKKIPSNYNETFTQTTNCSDNQSRIEHMKQTNNRKAKKANIERQKDENLKRKLGLEQEICELRKVILSISNDMNDQKSNITLNIQIMMFNVALVLLIILLFFCCVVKSRYK